MTLKFKGTRHRAMTAERTWQGITIERALASTGLYIPTTNSKTENSTTIVVGSNMTDSEVPVFENILFNHLLMIWTSECENSTYVTPSLNRY